jgi:N-formylglutamate amidohydrolase
MSDSSLEEELKFGMQFNPVVFHIPHSSKVIPAENRKAFLITQKELEDQLLRLTDHFTDELFSVPDLKAESVIYSVSRLVLDPERFLDDSIETMARKGMGVIYEKTSELEPLRNKPSAIERQRLIERYYIPHHQKLDDAVDRALEVCGYCLIVDCHSFPEFPLPYEDDQNPTRPEICVGADDYHTPDWLVGSVTTVFEAENFSTSVNRPFSGAFVPLSKYKRNQSVMSIMIEINRKLYMDEYSGKRLACFEEFKQKLHSCLKRIVLNSKKTMKQAQYHDVFAKPFLFNAPLEKK